MKINKQMQKDCILKIKENAADEGFKKIKNTIYKIENENIIAIDFLIVNSEKLIYRINIKKVSFDVIFWKVMEMEDNIKKGDALKVSGAFTAPSILIAKGEIELSENIDMLVRDFFEKIKKEVSNFSEKDNIVNYILSSDEIVDINILKCLSYIELNRLYEAKELARKQIALGNKGRFENNRKGFFELILLYDN